MEFGNETTLLQEVYKGAAMGSDALTQLMPKVDNPRLRSDLQTQLQQYQSTAAEAERQLKILNKCPQPLPGYEKAMLWGALKGQTLVNKETSHLAEMVIQGSNMGIINLTKVLNSYTSAGPLEVGAAAERRKQARSLAQQAITNEQNSIARLKSYLQ
jgi:hypothetical protein